LARRAGISVRALRFYQSKGLLTPTRHRGARLYGGQDRERLELILQGKRLGFTLTEIRQMIAARVRGCAGSLPISRRMCIEQIKHLELRRRDVELALAELRRIYTGLYVAQAS
jgi:DNA-binding transcriptional MerR regulator